MKTEGPSGVSCRRGALLVVLTWITPFVLALPDPVFHLNFLDFEDVSESGLDMIVGDAVALNPAGGPTLEGSGVTLDSAIWEGLDDETNQILIPDNEVLDEVALGPGSIVAWIKVEDEAEWNNICKTIEPGFSPTEGIEFQANQPSGVFGAVQGWNGNNFGPAHATNGGPGGSETPSGVWTHCALIWNEDGDHTVYVNGVPGVTVAQPGFGINMPGDWTIGGDPCCSGLRRLDGELADFAIFDEELSEDQLIEIMELGVSPPMAEVSIFHRGDSDGSGTIDITDGVVTLNILFVGGEDVGCKEAQDFNNDGVINITDGVATFSFLFAGGPPPVAPGPVTQPCGPDPDATGSPQDLGCNSYGGC